MLTITLYFSVPGQANKEQRKLLAFYIDILLVFWNFPTHHLQLVEHKPTVPNLLGTRCLPASLEKVVP